MPHWIDFAAATADFNDHSIDCFRRSQVPEPFAGTVAVDAGMTADDSRRECQSECQKSSEMDALELPAKIWISASSVGAE